jgi:hypothetical protein
MSEPIDLNEVERKVHRAFNQDGLIYLFMGILLTLVGLSFVNERLSWLGGTAVLLIFPIEILRRRITYPRIGYVRFDLPKGFTRGILGFVVIAVTVLSVLAFAGDGRFQRYLPLAISITMSLAFFFGASMQGLRLRDRVIIALMVVSGIGVTAVFEDWHWGTAVQMWLIALLLIIIGVIDLVRFVRRYPVMNETTQESS